MQSQILLKNTKLCNSSRAGGGIKVLRCEKIGMNG